VKFAERFPEIMKASSGRDWTYAGWLIELLGALEKFPNKLPVLFSEYSKVSPENMQSLPLILYGDGNHAGSDNSIVAVPLPPSGERL
jgi:hypothetical protein